MKQNSAQHVGAYDKKETAEIQKLFDKAQTYGDVQELSKRLNAFQQTSIARLNHSYIPRGACEALRRLHQIFQWSHLPERLSKDAHKSLHEAKKSFELGIADEARRERSKSKWSA